jgi:hypothetical protein
MGIIEERLMKDLRSLCIQDTLIKNIIKEVTILAVEICQMLDNHAMLIVTIVIKGRVQFRNLSPLLILYKVMVQDRGVPFQFRCKDDMWKIVPLMVCIRTDGQTD